MRAYKIPYDLALERLGPPCGPCPCGHSDRRHATLDAIRAHLHDGTRAEMVAAMYGYPVAMVRELVALVGEEG